MKSFCKGSYVLGSACGNCERCKEELERIKEKDVKDLSTEIILNIGRYEFETMKGVKTLPMFYTGWECDELMWALEDGRKFTTNHGTFCIFINEDFQEYRKELEDYLKEIKKL